ncbi:MAG: SMP-30/gluconolactonase/LRE family protein [bacterium]|nr:SMP-30/gluconolactonase/LRE family protein [bacterium]
MRGKRLAVIAAVMAGVAGTFLLIPAGIEPLAWAPPGPPALEGPLAPNTALRAVERIAEGKIHGPEDVAVDSAGRIYAGTDDGLIVRVTLDGSGGEQVETFAETGGRPLGLHFDAAGRLIVADAARGLLAVDDAGRVEPLATEAGGVRFRLADDLDVASDGRIYFSDASWRFGHENLLDDLLEARPHGRLLRHDPATGTTEVLLDDLYFANGIALSSGEDYVLVNETYRYRVRRYWLSGPRAGTDEIFLDNLPGFPDGVSSSGRGTFWLALYTVRNPTMDRLHPHVWIKRQMSKLPRFILPKPQSYGIVLEVGEDASVRRSLQDPTGERVPQITSAEEAGGFLFLGNLDRRWIGRFAL